MRMSCGLLSICPAGETPALNRALRGKRLPVASVDALPMNIAHERVNIGGGLGPEVEGVGMLVHVERQDRIAARQRVAMIGRPLVRQPAEPVGGRQLRLFVAPPHPFLRDIPGRAR
jgi:hypothetical protein